MTCLPPQVDSLSFHLVQIGPVRSWELLKKQDEEANRAFIEELVNDPSWAEPLRMIAEEVGIRSLEGAADSERYLLAGRLLVEMSLKVDLIFAAEVARLCGASVWREMRGVLSERLRAWYAVRDIHYRHCALARMLASGSDEFADIIVPLLSGEDEQARWWIYGTSPEFHLASLGPNWQDTVNCWPEERRVELVSELLHKRYMPEISSFAEADPSPKVLEAAIEGLTWIGAEEEATRLLKMLSPKSLNFVVKKTPLEMIPESFRSQARQVLGTQYEAILDPRDRISTLLKMAKLGDMGLSDRLKEELAKLPNDLIDNQDSFVIKPALDIVRAEEPEWVSRWVATRLSDGWLWPGNWMSLVTSVPDDLKEQLLQRIGSEDFKHKNLSGIIAVLVASAELSLVDSVFSKLCELHQTIDAAPDQQHKFEWALVRQLREILRALPVNLTIAGLADRFSSAIEASTVEIIVELFSNVARRGSEPLKELDPESKEKLHDFLKRSITVVLQQDDFHGRLKANLASVLAQVGDPEDMGDLQALIRADIERVRSGRAAKARGEGGNLVDGAMTSYASWHIQAVLQLDPEGADSMLLDLLTEPEYEWALAEELTHLASPLRSEGFSGRIDYRKIWDARAGQLKPRLDAERRKHYASALQDAISQLLTERSISDQPRPYGYRLRILAKALAAVGGQGSTDLILKVISLPEEWGGWQQIGVAEILLFNGVVLPAEPTLTLLDSTLERVSKYGLLAQDVALVKRFICLLFFIDDPRKGIDRVRQILRSIRRAHDLGDVATAAGYSHCEEALDFLREVAADETRVGRLEDAWINAVSAINTPTSRELLLSFIDPEVAGLPYQVSFERDDVLAARIADVCRRNPKAYARVLELSALELPIPHRAMLAKVIGQLDTAEAISAGLNLIADAAQPRIPYEIYRQVEAAFVEQRSYGENQGAYTQVARTANDIRVRLFEMVVNDEKRRKSAFSLLGQIEEWRLEYGRPPGELRCPVLGSVHPWPPREPM